jgi:(p)ppGpp synthase/HD superfamily hydrolase
MTSLLNEAILIAVQAHHEQTDRYNAPYILHPLRIMLRMQNETEQIAAVLHDLIEDTHWTLADLQQHGFPQEILNALDCLTHRANEPYDTYVHRAASNPIARRVKQADLEDNMDLRRITALTEKDFDRLDKYLRAWKYLETCHPQAGDLIESTQIHPAETGSMGTGSKGTRSPAPGEI